jgi:N-acetyl-1-D-myo-inositol-2-amino-2-deoxy-alpha-D-glucopyranoside deacetylase
MVVATVRPRNRLVDPRPGDVVLLLHAHPDDESVFTGGTIARLAAAGASVALVTATLGDLGVPRDARDRPSADERRELAARRHAELVRACETLGLDSHLLLGGEGRWGDSGIIELLRAPNALAANSAEAAGDLAELLRRVRPHVLVSYAEHGCTGHPDHLACHEIALRAASRTAGRLESIALIADTGLDLGGSGPRRSNNGAATLSIDIAAYAARKLRAVRCHESQATCMSVAGYTRRLLADDLRARTEDYLLIST